MDDAAVEVNPVEIEYSVQSAALGLPVWFNRAVVGAPEADADGRSSSEVG